MVDLTDGALDSKLQTLFYIICYGMYDALSFISVKLTNEEINAFVIKSSRVSVLF